MSNLKRNIGPMLRDSSFKSPKERKEIISIVDRLLNEHYNKDVVMERLLYKATFDREVFHRYFKQKMRAADVGCYHTDNEKAREIGFDPNSIFGGQLVMLVESFIEHHNKI